MVADKVECCRFDEFDTGEACYSNSGFRLMKDTKNDTYDVEYFSHCSCYDTEETAYVQNGKLSKDHLIKVAQNQEDLDIPGRTLDPNDYKYKYQVGFYKRVLEYFGVE